MSKDPLIKRISIDPNGKSDPFLRINPNETDRQSTDLHFTSSQIETIARAIARDEIRSHERRFMLQGAIALLSLSAIGELFRRVVNVDGLKYFISNLHNL